MVELLLPVDAAAGGDKGVFKQEFVGGQMDTDMGGSPIKYDSTSTAADSTCNPLSLVRSRFKLPLDTRTLTITRVVGRDAFLKKLVSATRQMKPLLDQILGDKALTGMAFQGDNHEAGLAGMATPCGGPVRVAGTRQAGTEVAPSAL